MSRKALFFDVDGTLTSDKTRLVPDSAVRALKTARAKGHKVFINSGRVICHLGKIQDEVEADGYLCGCGTRIIIDGQVLYEYHIPRERGVEIKRNIKKFGISAWLEGSDAVYMDHGPDRFQKFETVRAIMIREGVLSPYTMDDDCYDYDKFCVMTMPDEAEKREQFFRTLEPDMDVIDRGEGFYECVPKGHTKATAIDIVLKKYNISLEDAYVFGDSTNDLTMFQYAKNAVLMGEHAKELEPYATFVTKKVEEDGIEYAMKKLGII